MASTLFIGRIITMEERAAGSSPNSAAAVPAAVLAATPDAAPDAAPDAVLVEGDRIVAVGAQHELRALAKTDTEIVELGTNCLMPGLIEPHGHPSISAVLMSDYVLDIRPVTLATADEVMAALRAAIGERSGGSSGDAGGTSSRSIGGASDTGDTSGGKPGGVFANGWDPLLQNGLVNPTISELDTLAGDMPLVIVHNSGHSVFFNTAAARIAGVTDETPDPPGASFGRDENGRLTGVGTEAAAVFQIAGPGLNRAQGDFVRVFGDEIARANRAGITTIADMSWEAATDAGLAAMRTQHPLTARLRLYEMSAPGAHATATLGTGDDLVRHIGIKMWADGSPWIGNVATSFPYLDTPATQAMGLEPGHRGALNFTSEQILAIARQYAPDGWQLACHAHGDLAVDATLDAWQQVIEENHLTGHRFRLEHVGAMTPAQFERAAALGITVSIFSDHVYYWGDVLVDDLFGPQNGGRWADTASALAAGLEPSFHNDGTVTPLEPFRNMATAMTRRTRSGRVLDQAAGIGVVDALKAHTMSAAKQLFADDIVGSITPGKYADLIVIDRDPFAVTPEQLAETRVVATYFAGALVTPVL
ncbi:MAG: amidohydrolase [Subtercola sp.]|nr:amidohydrolase [Subtercola sp.]